MRAKNPSLPMSLKPKLSWVAEEEAANHRKLKNLIGGGRLADESFCFSDPETRTTTQLTKRVVFIGMTTTTRNYTNTKLLGTLQRILHLHNSGGKHKSCRCILVCKVVHTPSICVGSCPGKCCSCTTYC